MTHQFMVFVPGNVPEGPLDTQDLAQRLQSGLLPDSTMVCRVGGEQWVPIQEVLPPPIPAVELVPPPPAAAVPAEMAAPVASPPLSPKSKKKLIAVTSAAIVVVLGGIAAVASHEAKKSQDSASIAEVEGGKRADAVGEKKRAYEEQHQANRVFREHPNLPFEVKTEWFDRARGYLRGEVDESTCPQLRDLPAAADEFERKAARDRAIGQCRSENDRAVNLLKSCPFTTDLTYDMVLEEYNFERQAFTIKDGTTKWLRKSTVATSGRVWLHSAVLVTWPGAYSNLSVTTDELERSQEFCNGLNAVERENIRDAFLIDLKISEPDAKVLKDKIKNMAPPGEQIHARIQAALLLDGQTGQDTFSCGSKPAHPVPTGRVVAWRLVVGYQTPATDWISSALVDLAADCDKAQAFLGEEPVHSTTPTASTSPPATSLQQHAERNSQTVPITPQTTSASSFFVYGSERHPAADAFDGNPDTAWNEAHGKPGRGAWLEAQFAKPRHIRSIRLSTGYDAQSPNYGDLFVLNRHAKGITLLFDGGSTRNVNVGQEERQVALDDLDITTTKIRIVIDEVWEGTKWHDMCVSEVVIQGDPLLPEGTPAAAPNVAAAPNPAVAPSSAPPGMVFVHSGSFLMGSDQGKASEQPQRSVTLTRSFFIDKTEVTVSDYEQCLTRGKCSQTSIHGPDVKTEEVEKFSPMCNAQYPQRGDHPVNCVDRQQALVYCSFVDKRLPTESEWEYAARGTDGRIYPWGNDSPKCDKAVVSGCMRVSPDAASTRPVGSFPNSASPFGALDMAGNVWEWVSDDWDPQATTLRGSSREPGVLRGGSWDFAPTHLKSFVRLKFWAANGHVSTGFRCAKDAGP